MTSAVPASGSRGAAGRGCISNRPPAAAPATSATSTRSRRTRSAAGASRPSAVSRIRKMTVAVAAVVNTPGTPRASTVALCTPIASADIAASTSPVVIPGCPEVASQTMAKATCARKVSPRASETRADQTCAARITPTTRVATRTPAANPASDAATRTRFGPPASASLTPKNTTLPVWNAVNTLPRARNAIASTAPEENARTARRKSRSVAGDPRPARRARAGVTALDVAATLRVPAVVACGDLAQCVDALLSCAPVVGVLAQLHAGLDPRGRDAVVVDRLDVDQHRGEARRARDRLLDDGRPATH